MDRRVATLLCLGVASYPTGALAFDEAAVNELCDRTWGADAGMVSHCRKSPKLDSSKIDGLSSSLAADSIEAKVLQLCSSQWKTDYSMVIHCHDRQLADRLALETTNPMITADVVQSARSHCDAEWPGDFTMTLDCVNDQFEEWRKSR